jgi:bacillithiol biosynthesis deacetylase BshB1
MAEFNVISGICEPVDILAFGAHPDDVELGCGGLLAQEIQKGRKAAVCDLTSGEAGTRGTPEQRTEESRNAARILGLSARLQLHLKDGFIRSSETALKQMMEVIRRFTPRVVICNAPHDRHPDHGHAAQLVRDACFLAGLGKIDTGSAPHRPSLLLHYIQFYDLSPQLYYALTADSWKIKMQAIRAHASQFYDPVSREPQTLISSPEFLDFVEARARHYGMNCGVPYAEGFIYERPPAVTSLDHIL